MLDITAITKKAPEGFRGFLIKHSNDDYSDIPGKFGEALDKLIAFIPELVYKTKAVEEFEIIHSAQHYPGLGSIKKLSILNHLELVNSYLTTM